MYSNPYGYGYTPNELSNDDVYFGTSDYASEGGNTYYGDNEQSHLMNTSSATSEGKIELTSPIQDVVIRYDPFKNYDGITHVNYCLQDHKCEPLSLQFEQIYGNFKVNVSYNGMLLAEGVGLTKKMAEKVAGAKLLQTLRSTNYAIEPKFSYFPKRNLPHHVLNVDPKQSHIYKVVCLKRPNETDPFQLTGPVDYVQSEDELWQYITDHINSGSQADLYVLNVEPKKGRHQVHELIKGRSSVYLKSLLGCSNKAVAIYVNQTIQQIVEQLKACGGENVKYRLVPPGAKLSTLYPKNENSKKKDLHSLFDTKSAVDILKSEEELIEMSAQGHRDMIDIDQIGLCDQEDIEISQFIADNLIIMDCFKPNNTFEDDYHTIRLSVAKSAAFEEFMVDQKFDRNTVLYTSEARIDKNLVGRAVGFRPKAVKKEAAKNALHNLKKSCVHIKAKLSYFQQFPPVCNNATSSNKIFSVVNPWEGINEEDFGKILLRLKNSNIQDLFFCQNLKASDKKLLMSMAKDMNLLVRCNKTGSVCVYKKNYPNATYRLLKNTGENEKYTLIIPPKRSRNLTMANNVESYGNKESLQESKIKNLFDYERQYINPFHEVKVESNQSELYTPHQTVTSKQNERGLYNYMPLENNRDQCWQRSERQNELGHSRTNKRSYDDGPGSGEEREEQTSSSSHHSYNNQRRFESRQSFKEEKSRELNYKSREGQDNSFYSRRTIKHVEEGSREFNYQSREGQDSSFFSRRTIKTVREGSQEFNYKSREDQDSSFFSRRPNKPAREGSQELNYNSREDQYRCFFSRRPITPVQERSREFNYQPREGQNNNSNYGQYYQKEKRGNNDRHYNSRGLWSNEIKKNYDQRF